MGQNFRRAVWFGVWACLACLAGCQSMAPPVDEAAAPGVAACRVGDGSAQRTIQVEVWRGREDGLFAYSTARVCQQLQEVSRQLLSQGVRLRFEVMGAVQTHTGLGRANNASMQAITASDGRLKLVIVDAIAQCGDSVGYILGCTPQLGRPLIYAKRHDPFHDQAPEWVIWAHEMGHAVALYHPDAPGMGSVPERIMTYMPLPQSHVLLSHESANFAQLGTLVSPPRMHAALGQPPGPAAPIGPEQLLARVREAGPHGLPLGPLAHLDDAALMALRPLLQPGAGPQTQPEPGRPARTNALVLMAELGRDAVQAFVREYLVRQTDPAHRDLRLDGLLALGRGQLRHPTEASLAFLKQASDANFWCADTRQSASDCSALADAARDALRDAQSRP